MKVNFADLVIDAVVVAGAVVIGELARIVEVEGHAAASISRETPAAEDHAVAALPLFQPKIDQLEVQTLSAIEIANNFESEDPHYFAEGRIGLRRVGDDDLAATFERQPNIIGHRADDAPMSEDVLPAFRVARMRFFQQVRLKQDGLARTNETLERVPAGGFIMFRIKAGLVKTSSHAVVSVVRLPAGLAHFVFGIAPIRIERRDCRISR